MLLAVAAGAEIVLRETASAWGVDFRHHHGGSGRRYMPETVVGGVVLFDYDGDGDTDLLFVDAGALPGYEGEPAVTRLYRNDGAGRGGRFVDVTERSGIAMAAYGAGGAAGDVDGDGDLDLYLTALGPNQLYRNEGDGTFTDVTAEAGVGDPLFSSSAAFADPDRDGDLDLYVANYVAFTVDSHRRCDQQGIEVYCYPGFYDGLPDRYYRNRGDGRFEEAAAEAGLATEESMAGLGVVFGDVDDDGWPDLYVANDADPNFLFLNKGDGRFEETALLAGTAYGDTGRPEAGMGLELGDVDGDGRLDLVVTNFELETNALYKNVGAGLFVDGRYASNVAEPSLFDLAFGVVLADLDLDADLDLALANGHILDNAERFHEKSRFAQPNRVLENVGGGRFRNLAGTGFETVGVSRGLAAADLDLDGDVDLAVNNNNSRAELFENATPPGPAWLALDLAGAGSNTAGIGARAKLVAGAIQVREARTASSFQSQGAAALHFGVGARERVELLELSWPSGKRQRFADLPVRRRLRLFEGDGPRASRSGSEPARGAAATGEGA